MAQDNLQDSGYREDQGYYKPKYPVKNMWALSHEEMNYNLDLIGQVIQGYRVMGSGDNGSIDPIEDTNKILKLHRVQLTDTEYILNGAQVDDYVWIVTDDIGSGLFTMGGEINANLIPNQDITYDLGSPNRRFRDLYLSNNTIYLGDDAISMIAGKIRVNGELLASGSSLVQEAEERARLLGIETESRIEAINTINQQINAISDENLAISESISSLGTQFNNDLVNAITGERLARNQAISTINETLTSLSDVNGSLAQSMIDLNTYFATEIDDKIGLERTARTEAISTINQALTFLSDANGANAESITSLQSSFSTVNTKINEETAARESAIAAEILARNAAIQAVADIIPDFNTDGLATTEDLQAESEQRLSDIAAEAAERARLLGIETQNRTDAIAGIQEELASIAGPQGAIVQATNSLSTQFTTELEDLNTNQNLLRTNAIAAVESSISALTTANEAVVNSVSQLGTKFEIDLNNAITGEADIRAEAITNVTNEIAALSNANGAAVTRVNTLESQYTLDQNGNITGLQESSAILQTIDSAVTTANQATIESTTNAIATLNDQVAGVTQGISASVDALTNKVNAQYTLEVNADGNIAGMKLGSDETGSSIAFTADSFKVSTGGPQGQLLTPFSIINGQVAFNGSVSFGEGTQGTAGTSSYLHIAYANNSTGTNGFSITDSTGKIYLGQYTSNNAVASTDPTLYKWTLIKGETGAQGATGAQGVAGAQGASGSAGVNARTVSLRSGTQVFEYNALGTTPSPVNAVITALAWKTSGTVYYNFYKNDVSVQHSTSNAYTYTPQASYSSMPDIIEVEIREGSTNGPVLARDQITMAGIKPGTDGVDGITVILSNEAHTLPTTSAGAVKYLGSGTTIRVFEGINEVLYDGVGTSASRWKATASPTSITVGTFNDSGNFLTVGNHSNMTDDTAKIIYTITGKRSNGTSFSFTKEQTFSKSLQGETGATGPQGPAPDTSTYLTTTSTIDGGKITTGIIKNGNFAIPVSATNATNATNLQTAGWDTYATSGMGINLDKGAINSKNFYIDPSGNATFRGDMDIDGGVKVGGSLMADFFEVAPTTLGGPKILRMKSNAYVGTVKFDELKEDLINSRLTSEDPVSLVITLSHQYVKRNNTLIEPGDLVKLDQNNELVKADSARDNTILGILWEEVDYSIKPHPLDKYRTTERVFVEEDHHYRDSLGNKLPVEDRETKTIWKVAAIGDSREGTLGGFNICNQNGPVIKGDLLCSSDTPGYVMKQPTEWVIIGFEDGIPQYEERQNITSYTVGKCMEDCQFDENGKAKGIYGYLYCG